MPHDLKTQLSNYGSWLEQRSDVELRSPEIEIVPDASSPSPDEPPDGSERPLTRILVAAGVLAVAVVSGLILALPGGDADEVVAGSTIDQADDDRSGSSDGDRDSDRSSDSTRSPATTVDARPTDARPSDTRPTDTGPVVTRPTDTRPATTTTTVAARPVDVAGGLTFVTPGAGAKVSLDDNIVFEVAPIDGAAGYSFAGWQNGQQILNVSGANHRLILPSRFLTTDGGWPPTAGRFTMTVVATDRSGATMADGEITVVIATSKGRPAATLTIPTTNPTGTRPTIDAPIPTVPESGKSTLVTIPKGPNL